MIRRTHNPLAGPARMAAAALFPCVLAVLPFAGPAPVAAQDRLDLEHVTTFPESFGFLQTVRPLAEGDIMVADPLGRILAVADWDTGTLEPVGREGQGPGEWKQPDAVYPLPGDSTLLVDLGNTRLTVIDPEGRLVESYPMVVERPGRGPMGMEIIQPAGVDGMGRVYFQARGGMMRPRAGPDSSRIKRWAPGDESAAEIAALTPPAITVSRSGGANDQRVRMTQIPLAPQDAWAVASDGSVAVVRAAPYRVEWIRTDGTAVHGPEIDYRSVPVGTAEKERYLDERDTGGLRMEMNVDNGVRTLGMQRGGRGAGDRERANELRTLDWPETLPAIREGGAMVAPDGRLWVRRFVAVGEPGAYDVFDRTGHRVATVTLPAGREVIGFDGDRVFAVRVDELGLNWLELYR